MHKSAWAVSMIVLATVGACASYPVNGRLDKFDTDAGYRFRNLTPQCDANSTVDPDELFVILTFSGGGTRAAALAYGVMEQLASTKIYKGKRSLLDEVDVISSVSGGSFTAAYYALFREKLFHSFEKEFLKVDVQGALVWRLLSPLNLIRLASPWFSRIDMAAEYYSKHIFDKQTYGDLARASQRPFLILNAADMTFGMPFEFSQEQFDLLYSDLETVPVARAVAASSAFPGLFSPLTLKNHQRQADFEPPPWIELAIVDREFARRRYRRALQAQSFANLKNRPYVHLLDGGVVDNLGVPAILRALTTTDSEWSVLSRINNGKVKKVVVIVVNAQTDADTSWDRRSNAPNIAEALGATINGLQGGNTFESAARLWEMTDHARKDQDDYDFFRKILKDRHCNDTNVPGGPLPPVQYHIIEVSFDLIPIPKSAHYFKNLPTSFSLQEKEVDCLTSVGKYLLAHSPEFKNLVDSLDGESPCLVEEKDLLYCE